MIEIFTNEIMLYAGAFLFVFGAVYGLLITMKIFPKQANAVISLGIALFAIAYSPLIITAMPILSIIFLIFFFVYFIKIIFKKSDSDFVPVIAAMGMILLALPLAGITLQNITYSMKMNIIYFIALVIIVIMFYAAYKSG